MESQSKTTVLNAALIIFVTSLINFNIIYIYLKLITEYKIIDEVHLEGTLSLYSGYAKRAIEGEVPYRDYSVEYPFGAFPFFVIPGLFAWASSYSNAFIIEMASINFVMVYLVVMHASAIDGLGGAIKATSWYTAYFACLCPLIISRYDLAPTVMAFAGAHWWFSKRSYLGGLAIGLGILTKIFPGVIAALAILQGVYRGVKPWYHGLLSLVATFVIGILFWASISLEGMKESIHYQMHRGFEVESLYASIIISICKTTNYSITCEPKFGCWQLVAVHSLGLVDSK